MKIICILLVVICVCLLCRLAAQKRRIHNIRNQIEFLIHRDTRTEITLDRLDKSTESLAVSINHLLEKHRYTGQQIEKNDILFKDTITSLSHDLRTPLATANGYIQLLSEQELTAEQKEYVEIAGERMKTVKILLDQLFEFARIEANELSLQSKDIDVNSVLRDVLAAYYKDFENRKTIPEIEIPDKAAIIWADTDALSRAFSNIIFNSLIHGDGGYKISSAITENSCSITISNHSKTICKEDIPRLFDRFYTTDQSRTKKTTGLGLAITRKLVLQMGGEISADLCKEIFSIHLSFPIL